MSFDTTVKLLLFGFGKLKRFGRFFRNAVPDIVDKLNMLGYREALIVVEVFAHIWIAYLAPTAIVENAV